LPYQNTSYTITPNSIPPNSFNVQPAVGYTSPPASAFSGYTVDIGSMGVLMLATELPTPVPAPTAGGPVIGPGWRAVLRQQWQHFFRLLLSGACDFPDY
jgi:hypothetical protein